MTAPTGIEETKNRISHTALRWGFLVLKHAIPYVVMISLLFDVCLKWLFCAFASLGLSRAKTRHTVCHYDPIFVWCLFRVFPMLSRHWGFLVLKHAMPYAIMIPFLFDVCLKWLFYAFASLGLSCAETRHTVCRCDPIFVRYLFKVAFLCFRVNQTCAFRIEWLFASSSIVVCLLLTLTF